jgi:DNA-binding SARP family transcriptional activator
VQFRILGALEVHDGPRTIEIRAGNDRALLVLLLLHANEVVSSYRLIEDLWSGSAPASAPKILQACISRLRRALGADRIETHPPGYRLRVEQGELDVTQFEQLIAAGKGHEALRLWRGTPLVELEGRWFANVLARRLDDLHLTAVEVRIDEDLAAGAGARLVPELEQIVAAHPYRERPHGQLMRALYAASRQAEALAVYRGLRERLSDELGLEPGPELREVHAAVLRQDASLTVTSAGLRAAGRRESPLPPAAA